MSDLAASELPLNDDGSIYHLALHPDEIAHTILIAGDPARARKIASYFDRIEFERQNREFCTFTGELNGKRLSAMSTGIGTDNIDIALNELDALVNIDLQNRQIKPNKTELEIIRLGTCGALQEGIEIDSFVASKYGFGFDGLLNFYQVEYSKDEMEIRDAFIAHSSFPDEWSRPYVVRGDQGLLNKVAHDLLIGITATAPGFYAPQGRKLRASLNIEDMNDHLRSFQWQNERFVNFEMETSALFGLSKILGHKAATVCTVVANRMRKEKSKNYQLAVSRMIEQCLERLTA
ncbi:MAG: nucleoside phosphorylase [Bacteroidota bacterium]